VLWRSTSVNYNQKNVSYVEGAYMIVEMIDSIIFQTSSNKMVAPGLVRRCYRETNPIRM
jgi:hypothetical protein